MSGDPECPVLATARIVSGKWTLILLRDLAAGRRRFGELQRSMVGISPRTLSQRLRALEEQGIVTRTSYAEMPPRVEYHLTPRGQALTPIIDEMRRYGERWLADEAGSEAALSPGGGSASAGSAG